jgi:hypothetical protein
MYKDMKMIYNVIQCVLCNSSRCHYLEPLRKGVIAKMTYLAEFWLILERDLVECSPHGIFVELYENIKKNTIGCTLTKKFSFTEFGSVMKNL